MEVKALQDQVITAGEVCEIETEVIGDLQIHVENALINKSCLPEGFEVLEGVVNLNSYGGIVRAKISVLNKSNTTKSKYFLLHGKRCMA